MAHKQGRVSEKSCHLDCLVNVVNERYLITIMRETLTMVAIMAQSSHHMLRVINTRL